MVNVLADARRLTRQSLKASLATLDSPTGAPYASLITLATDASGAPIFLISTLARHTRNLANDPRAAILLDGTGAGGAEDDPLQGARLTLSGIAQKTDDERVRCRFLARQPQAAFYADFPDFSFWTLTLEGAHFIGGFGRIVDLTPEDILIPQEGAEALLDAEPGIVAHMNEDHADAIALYAQCFGGVEPVEEGPGWTMTGLDPEGFDLVSGAKTLRLCFEKRIGTAQEARSAFVSLVNKAKATLGSG